MIITEETYKNEIKGKFFYVSPSAIKPRECNTPKHIKFNMEHKKPDTPAKKFGRAFHCAILEPEKFKTDYALLSLGLFGDNPKLNKDGSINKVDAFNKSILADFAEKNQGKQILDFDDAEAITKCKESILSLQDIGHFFTPDNAYIETMFLAFARFDESNNFREFINMELAEYTSMMEHEKIKLLPVLCRIDYGDKIGTWLIDFKTVDDITPESFSKDCWTYGYHIQVAMEFDIVNAALGLPEGKMYDVFYFICVENHPPYDSVYFCPKSTMENGPNDTNIKFIEAGRLAYQTKLSWIQNARVTGKWEGISIYSDYYDDPDKNGKTTNKQIIRIDLPAWYFKSNLNLL